LSPHREDLEAETDWFQKIHNWFQSLVLWQQAVVRRCSARACGGAHLGARYYDFGGNNPSSLVSCHSKGGRVNSSIMAVTPAKANQITRSSNQLPFTKKASGIETHIPVHFTHSSNFPEKLALLFSRKLAKILRGPSSLANKNDTRHVAKAAMRNRK
jgi:hypothetical protein